MTSSTPGMGASTVGALFLQAARQWPTKEALVEGSTVLTHEEAAARALAVAHRLIQWGIRPGDRVALALPNGWRYAVAYAGVQLAGGVAVLVNTRFAPTEITHVLTDSGSRVVVVDAEIAPRVPEVCPHLDVEGLTASGPGSSQPPGLEADTDDVANILYTSGTTGRPKGAMQTHGNLLFNAAAVGSVLGVRAEDRTLVVAPMFHATGMNSQLIGFGALGATCVFQPRFHPSQTLRALVEHRISVFAGVTAMIHLLLEDPGFPTADLTALRTICFGGAPVLEAFLARAAGRLPHVQFGNVWGMTESTSITTCALGHELLERPWTVGRPVPGMQVIVADGLDPLPAGSDSLGELWVRGPAVAKGYWGLPEATAETFRSDGWLRTGDVGRVDADGYVQVVDRLKDMIIRGGENIYSLEVENALARHPAIAEVAVVGMPDEIFGGHVRAVVVLHPGASLSIDELRKWARKELADYKLPVELLKIDALPRNPNGKILKTELSALGSEDVLA